MSTILQDMMGMLKRNGTVTPKADNYITVARYPSPQERLKPAPKLQTELVTLSQLKTFFNAGGGSAVSSIVAGTNVTISPAGGTGAVTVNATVPALPYTSSFIQISQTGQVVPSSSFLANDAGLTIEEDWRLGQGVYRFKFTDGPASSKVMVVLPGGAGDSSSGVLALFSQYYNSDTQGRLIIESYHITPEDTLDPQDLGQDGNQNIIIEIRVFN